MLAAVDRFLGGEGLDFAGQLGRGAVAVAAHAFDEKGLAFREGRRQRIVERGRDRVAAVPPARRAVARARTCGRAA